MLHRKVVTKIEKWIKNNKKSAIFINGASQYERHALHKESLKSTEDNHKAMLDLISNNLSRNRNNIKRFFSYYSDR